MPRKPDRYERLASHLPMRDPVAGPSQLRNLGLRALVGALQGGPRYGTVLLEASDETWEEHLHYVADEYPTFFVGHEGRIAKTKMSRDGYRIYEATGRSNMLELSIEHLREFLEDDPTEEADQVPRLPMRMECAKQVRRRDDRPPGTSPLD